MTESIASSREFEKLEDALNLLDDVADARSSDEHSSSSPPPPPPSTGNDNKALLETPTQNSPGESLEITQQESATVGNTEATAEPTFVDSFELSSSDSIGSSSTDSIESSSTDSIESSSTDLVTAALLPEPPESIPVITAGKRAFATRARIRYQPKFPPPVEASGTNDDAGDAPHESSSDEDEVDTVNRLDAVEYHDDAQDTETLSMQDDAARETVQRLQQQPTASAAVGSEVSVGSDAPVDPIVAADTESAPAQTRPSAMRRFASMKRTPYVRKYPAPSATEEGDVDVAEQSSDTAATDEVSTHETAEQTDKADTRSEVSTATVSPAEPSSTASTAGHPSTPTPLAKQRSWRTKMTTRYQPKSEANRQLLASASTAGASTDSGSDSGSTASGEPADPGVVAALRLEVSTLQQKLAKQKAAVAQADKEARESGEMMHILQSSVSKNQYECMARIQQSNAQVKSLQDELRVEREKNLQLVENTDRLANECSRLQNQLTEAMRSGQRLAAQKNVNSAAVAKSETASTVAAPAAAAAAATAEFERIRNVHKEELASMHLQVQQLHETNQQLNTRIAQLSAAVARTEQQSAVTARSSALSSDANQQTDATTNVEVERLRAQLATLEREHADELQARNDAQRSALQAALAEVEKLRYHVNKLEQQADADRAAAAKLAIDASLAQQSAPVRRTSPSVPVAAMMSPCSSLSAGMLCQLVTFSVVVFVLLVVILSRFIDSLQQETVAGYY